MQKQLTPFEVENTRADLAARLNFDKLREMYSRQYPQIQDHNTAELWDRLNIHEKPLIKENPMEDERLTIVSSLIKGNNIRTLNVGFGTGNLEQRYFGDHPQTHVEWTGIDISHDSVKKVEREYPSGSFSVGDILDLQFPKDIFDYVIALEVLEHIPPSKTLKGLAEALRVLKPGGRFIASVPLNEGLEAMIARGENPNAHVRVYTRDLIAGELLLAGFHVLDTKFLYAFHTMHAVKTFIARYSLLWKWQPNNVIVVAQKPESLSCHDIKYQVS